MHLRSVAAGERVLADKGCLSCHSLNGQGGNRAPDFSNPHGAAPASRVCSPRKCGTTVLPCGPSSNPRTSRFPRCLRWKLPIFTRISTRHSTSLQREMPCRGRAVFEDKRLRQLPQRDSRYEAVPGFHKIGAGKMDGPEGSHRLGRTHVEPLQRNHCRQLQNRGINWPRLSERDIVDLMTFLSKLPDTEPQHSAFAVGEPGLGRNVFRKGMRDLPQFRAPF